MELFDRILNHFELKKQKKEFDKLFSDILFTRFYILYEAQKENEKPDGELVTAARDCALTFEDGFDPNSCKLMRDNIQKKYGFSSKLNKYDDYGTIEENETALEKIKKYIYSNIPILTYDEKQELVSKVFDIYKIGLDDVPADDESGDEIKMLINHFFENKKTDLSQKQENERSL